MTPAPGFTDPAIAACADLVGRAGASKFEIGYLDDDPENPRWYASAFYRGARLTADDHRTPAAAATALAGRILAGGTCRCRRPVTLADGDGCRWRLVGTRWEPGCGVEGPLISGSKRGDYAALREALTKEQG